MLIKIGIIILIFAIFGPLIGNIFSWVQDIVFGLFYWCINLSGRTVMWLIVIFLILRIYNRFRGR